MMAVWKRILLFPALFLTALVASSGDWSIALGVGLALGILQFLKSSRAVGFLDLFDRSTVAFGLAAGLPFGFNAAKDADAGQTALNAILHALLGPAGAVILTVFIASFWVRGRLIRQSLRKGYLS